MARFDIPDFDIAGAENSIFPKGVNLRLVGPQTSECRGFLKCFFALFGAICLKITSKFVSIFQNFLHSHRNKQLWLFASFFIAICQASYAQKTGPDVVGTQDAQKDEQVVEYPASFFDRYNPVTALDMVNRVPGFQVNLGTEDRGFSGTAGNILINSERPSTKDDTPDQILGRIPATQVERIDLIRGRGGELDLRGQSIAVNVILREDAGAAIKWEALIEQDFDNGPPTPRGNISIRNRLGRTQYTAGLEVTQTFGGTPGVELIRVEDMTIEERIEFDKTKRHTVDVNLNTTTTLEKWLINFNGQFGYMNQDNSETSDRFPVGTLPPVQVLEGDGEREFEIEVGGDITRPLMRNLTGKLIVLFNYENTNGFESVQFLDEDEIETESSFAEIDTQESESILRLEFDWTALEAHTVELNLEGAFNTLDNALELTVDTGEGPIEVPVPGANSSVEEIRGDFAISDSLSFGDFVLDSELAIEISQISQSGDASLERSFFFSKPNFSLTYSPSANRQARVRIQRLVSQLDFNDFVSSTNFSDEQLDLGNPDLRPETTWHLEIAYEQRFGQLGVITTTLFHDWIDDVEDVLPITGIFEVPGNIGNGKRYGFEVAATLPLDVLGPDNARLDGTVNWQHSSVTDPVTNMQRVLSDEPEFESTISFRQDFIKQRWAWGASIELISGTPSFGIDELDITNEGPNLEAFLETTRWFGLKSRVVLRNILDRQQLRDRTVFARQRGLSPVLFRQILDNRRDLSIRLSLSGIF